MIIIAHRGNITGPNPPMENNIPYLMEATSLGFGIELDIRTSSDSSKLVISHDAADYEPNIDAVSLKLIDPSAFMAINIKEFGLADKLAEILPGRNGFVFDFELIDMDCKREMQAYRAHGFKVAKRISDAHPTVDVDCDFLWIDEMRTTGLLDLSNVDLSKCIYVSPELHKRPLEDRRHEKFAGVCTDYTDAWG
jgi:hypothetical protein